MELSTTVGAEVAALLAPDPAGACLRRGCAVAGDPASPDDAVAPFADVLLDAEAACLATLVLPPGGNVLPPPAAVAAAAGVSAAPTSPLAFAVIDSGPPPAGGSRDALPAPPSPLAELPALSELPAAEPSPPAADEPPVVTAAVRGSAQPPSAVLPGPLPAATTTVPSIAAPSDDAAGMAAALPAAAVAVDPAAAGADTEFDTELGREPTPTRLEARRSAPSAEHLRSATPSTDPPLRHLADHEPPPLLRDRPAAAAVARMGDAPVAALPTAPAMPEHAAVQRADPAAMPIDVGGGGRQPLPDALADRVQWMVDQHLGSAKLKLNPPHLGALDVSIRVGDDGTYVHFTSAHAGARDALEAALPRLRELLGAAGLELSGASVGGERTSREPPPAPVLPHAASVERPGTELHVFTALPSQRRIDLYA